MSQIYEFIFQNSVHWVCLHALIFINLNESNPISDSENSIHERKLCNPIHIFNDMTWMNFWFYSFCDAKPKLQVEGAGLWRSGAGISCCSACTIYSRENEKSKDRKPETDGPSPHAVLTNNKCRSSTSPPLHFLPPCRGKRASRTLSPSAGDYTEVWSSS